MIGHSFDTLVVPAGAYALGTQPISHHIHHITFSFHRLQFMHRSFPVDFQCSKKPLETRGCIFKHGRTVTQLGGMRLDSGN